MSVYTNKSRQFQSVKSLSVLINQCSIHGKKHHPKPFVSYLVLNQCQTNFFVAFDGKAALLLRRLWLHFCFCLFPLVSYSSTIGWRSVTELLSACCWAWFNPGSFNYLFFFTQFQLEEAIFWGLMPGCRQGKLLSPASRNISESELNPQRPAAAFDCTSFYDFICSLSVPSLHHPLKIEAIDDIIVRRGEKKS